MPKLTEVETNDKRITDDAKVYRYWMDTIKFADKKKPKKQWVAAKARLQGDSTDDADGRDDKRPYINRTRNLKELQLAYIDQREASFDVSPTKAFIQDTNHLQRAECDSAYLEYIWREQKCQQSESRKLDSALVRNVGHTRVGFDTKKWMPSLTYISPENVSIDKNCKGDWTKASWMSYWEDISLEQLSSNLKSAGSNLTPAEWQKLKNTSASALTDEEQKELDDNDTPLYAIARVTYIFARNDAAVRFYDDTDEQEVPDKKLAEELKLETKRRYLVFVGNIQRPIINKDKWPFDLDHDEFPINTFVLNTVPDDTYGFTDFKQMSRMEGMSDSLMFDLEEAGYWAAIKKFVGKKSGEAVSDTTIQDFLQNATKSYLADMLDQEGKPKIVELQVGQIDQAQMALYELVDTKADKASGQSELLIESVADYKDVTALAVRAQESKLHQRINHRLGGPRGYEHSMSDDAVKMLEIAHQFVPRYSSLTVQVPEEITDPESGEFIQTGKTYEDVKNNVPWDQALQLISSGEGKLIKLGVDAIVGPRLAPFWATTEELPLEFFRLSTDVSVVPGSTRTITKEQQAEVMKRLFLEIYAPIYEKMGRMDLAVRFSKRIGILSGLDDIDSYLPSETEVAQFTQQSQQQQQEQQQMELEQQQSEMEQQQVDSQLQAEKQAVEAEVALNPPKQQEGGG